MFYLSFTLRVSWFVFEFVSSTSLYDLVIFPIPPPAPEFTVCMHLYA